MMCPSKDCTNSNQIHWVHTSCREVIQINELAQLRCKFHRAESNIFSWRFDCGMHTPHNGSSSFHSPDRNKLLAVLACAIKFTDQGADDDWIDNLILNLRKSNKG